ncbi:GDSL esterase/lipase At1g71250-like [Zingiber officinale]|uniref:GDSL esterase/lipase At1g71250-like n=1 Tax=Zingiber officinale TaxID=94328 RepID=UPI001C4C9B73|nr:GDSL esterase/lipase At1g71250-like [Zingiber officinale]
MAIKNRVHRPDIVDNWAHRPATNIQENPQDFLVHYQVWGKMATNHAFDVFLCWFLAAKLDLYCSTTGALGAPQIPAMFVFGDSLVDDGNNNVRATVAQSNFYPYGIDSVQGPTGRFSNGKTIVDVLCDLLGLPYLPAQSIAGLNGTALLGGVNYASGNAGILDETGQHLGERVALSQQVMNFEGDWNQLRTLMGGGRTFSQYLARSIVVMVFGSNDYINNFLLPALYSSSYNYAPQDFANLLLNHYTRQILALHSLGLRKFLLAGIAPLGCIPEQRSAGTAPPDRCVDQVNQMLGYFNEGLRSLVQQLNTNHPGAIFAYSNTYAALGDILNSPSRYGFSIIDRGCCEIGRNQAQLYCVPLSVPCTDRNRYVFWDGLHTTQAVNSILAQRAFVGPPNDVYPINVQQMAQL